MGTMTNRENEEARTIHKIESTETSRAAQRIEASSKLQQRIACFAATMRGNNEREHGAQSRHTGLETQSHT